MSVPVRQGARENLRIENVRRGLPWQFASKSKFRFRLNVRPTSRQPPLFPGIKHMQHGRHAGRSFNRSRNAWLTIVFLAASMLGTHSVLNAGSEIGRAPV